MDKLGLVSIGIPAYNRPSSLDKILSLITSQSYTNLEIIISDDASEGNDVRNVVEKYQLLDSRIKYFRQEENIGVLRNYNFVLQQSTGEFFTCVSDDDWRSPEFIEVLIRLLIENPQASLAFCDYHEIYEDGKFAIGYPFSHIKHFTPFKSKNRLARTLSHYWQNQKNGKCNLFYGLFRKNSINTIDVEKLSNNFTHLGMDNQIVFKMLQLGPAVFSNDAMCCLTCDNTKYYMNNSSDSKKRNLFYGVINVLNSFLDDNLTYLNNASFFIEKIFIILLFLPKILSELVGVLCVRLLGRIKKIFNYTNYLGTKNEISQSDRTEAGKLQLSNVTLISVDTRDTEEALQVLKYSSRDIDFGGIKLLSHFTPFCNDKRIVIERIPKFNSIDDWCHFVIYELYKYIDTDFILLIHVDGFVVNPFQWRSEFLDYDYIGSPFPLPTDKFSYRDIYGNIIRVGNSVSIRSKKILELPTKLKIPWTDYHGFFNEDGFLCTQNRHILEANGIRYAPLEIAKYFAHESMIPEIKNIKPFAFHKWMGTNSTYPNFKKKDLYDCY